MGYIGHKVLPQCFQFFAFTTCGSKLLTQCVNGLCEVTDFITLANFGLLIVVALGKRHCSPLHLVQGPGEGIGQQDRHANGYDKSSDDTQCQYSKTL